MGQLLHPLFALLASTSRQELARQLAYLKEENRILRARLPKQIIVTPKEKRRLLRYGKRLGLQLKELISIVSYKSFQRWIRETEKARTEKQSKPNRKPGRPKTPVDIRELVVTLARENTWGYTRIMGELRKLGINLSKQTIKVILKENGIDPCPERGGTWDEFLRIHADTLWQCDFVSKPMWTMKGLVDLYFLVFLHLGSRKVWISTCTPHPDSAWVCQQGRNFLMEYGESDIAPQQLLRDNDVKYNAKFDEVFKSSGITVMRTVPVSPNLRAHVERFIQTLKVECLDKFVIVAERHLNFICREFRLHYNRERPHSARSHLPPGCEQPPETNTTVKPSDIVCETRLGGLLKHYSRRAA